MTTREDAIKQCEDFIEHHSDWSVEVEWASGVKFILEDYKRLIEQEPILDKIRADITKLADTIPFISGDIKAKYTNIGQHDGLEQALEIIDGNIKGDFDIDEWMAENE